MEGEEKDVPIFNQKAKTKTSVNKVISLELERWMKSFFKRRQL